MSKKYTYEEVKNNFEQNGYIVLSTEYTSCKEKLLCLDKQGYKLLMSFDKLKNRKINGLKFHSSNPHTIENINHYTKINGLTSKCVSNTYVNSKSKLNFICECGKPFCTSWDNFSSRHKIKCDDCSKNPFINKDYISVKSLLLTHGFILDVKESEYLGVTLTPLMCHDKNGYKYCIVYDAILRKEYPSPVSKTNQFSIYNINVFLKNNNKDFICISDQFVDRETLLEFVCNRCGETVFTKWGNMNKTDNTSRNIILCPNCDGKTESIHALVLKQMFKYHYPDTIEEEPSCVNPITNCILPTDIVNHKLKIAIEVQSEWHDREYQQVKDKIKKDFWLSKGYNFYDPDIRHYSVLEMCQLFFNIDELPDYINYEYSNKINIKKVQSMLDKNMSPKDIANYFNINVHKIYDSIYAGKLHYSDTYIRKDYKPIVKLDTDDNFIEEYVTISKAAIDNNIDVKKLASILRKGKHEYAGFIWYYKSEYENLN